MSRNRVEWSRALVEAASKGELPPEQEAGFWSIVRERVEAEREFEEEGLAGLIEREASEAPAVRPSSSSRIVLSDDDPLRSLTAREYFEALTGESVPHSGMVRCPSRDHEDRHPSCHVGGVEEGLWHCFSCGAGSTVYDLGAEISGIEPRGQDFHELRTWIAQRLLGAPT
jgi:hypothetical protein